MASFPRKIPFIVDVGSTSNEPEPHFNGPEYDSGQDFRRLKNQHLRIRKLMSDGEWRTLAEIKALTGDPPASISAQLRHLRKPRFGSWTVERRARGNRRLGLFEYRLLPPKEPELGLGSKKPSPRVRKIQRHEWETLTRRLAAGTAQWFDRSEREVIEKFIERAAPLVGRLR